WAGNSFFFVRTCANSSLSADIVICLSMVLLYLFWQYRAYFSVRYCPKIIPESYTTSLNQSSLREIIRWTEENFSKPIQLSMVANKLGYSKYYFCSRFKALTGTTYIRYLNTVRISHAYKLLNAGASVTEAGIACGFSDIGYFIQMFKKMYGVTPKKYVRDRIGTSCKNHIENGPDERINR
ncbi:MAG: AraC family transcriptional regulator, partial [Candidatus Limiplasma sp.]|nr:AraC family transcriptional regulator [Candidatus Limiplasma sp.]